MDTNAPWRALETAEAARPEAASAPSGRRAFVVTIAVAAFLAIGALGVVAFIELSPKGQVEVISGPADTGTRSSGPSAQMVVVQVSGAVMRPGVFTLPAGSRVSDAIRAAGGYSAEVDPRQAETKLNLAAKLSDAELIVVPRLGAVAASGVLPEATTGGLLNLNAATAEQLDALPGIGPATAAKIISSRAERPFASIDDLVSRKLVTAATLAKFRDYVTAG